MREEAARKLASTAAARRRRSPAFDQDAEDAKAAALTAAAAERSAREAAQREAAERAAAGALAASAAAEADQRAAQAQASLQAQRDAAEGAMRAAASAAEKAKAQADAEEAQRRSKKARDAPTSPQAAVAAAFSAPMGMLGAGASFLQGLVPLSASKPSPTDAERAAEAERKDAAAAAGFSAAERARLEAASGSGVSSPASPATPGGAAFTALKQSFSNGLPPFPPPAGAASPGVTSWKVDYTPGNHVMCRACFASLAEGTVRVTASTPAVAYYHLAKQFYHLHCKPPSCEPALVAGLAQLTAKDRESVQEAMTAAAH